MTDKLENKFDYIARRLANVKVKGEAGNLITAIEIAGAERPEAVLSLIAQRVIQLAEEYDLKSMQIAFGFKDGNQ